VVQKVAEGIVVLEVVEEVVGKSGWDRMEVVVEYPLEMGEVLEVADVVLVHL
jgi:hypothetical protein